MFSHPTLPCSAQCVEYLGNLFRLQLEAPPHWTDYQAGEHLLRTLLFIHLDSPAEKLSLAVQMMVKLYALVREEIWTE